MFDLTAFSNAFGVVFLCFILGVIIRLVLKVLQIGRRNISG